MKIVKTFSFDIAHMLDGHDGKCKNLHGHAYQLEVEISGPLIEEGPKEGMVLDFSDLKQAVKQWVVDPMDHAFLYHRQNERELALAQMLEGWRLKTYGLDCRTTAEAISRHIFHSLRDQADLPISRIRLWETPTSYSEYEGE